MFPFNPHGGLIPVRAEIEGPFGIAFPWLALDTGAVQTVVSEAMLVGIGYNPAQATSQVPLISVSGVIRVPLLTIARLTALGQTRNTFAVVAHTLPPAAAFDGVLGLDFLRGKSLKIDFRTGLIDLT